jgi:hypothetical protein
MIHGTVLARSPKNQMGYVVVLDFMIHPPLPIDTFT